MPKVSVVVPNYNHARFLEQRILSILQQTYQDFELVYLDDASTDKSAEVFARFADNPKIRSVLNSTNSGSAFKQWNKGVREAQSEFIWLAEADDYAAPDLLQKLVEKLEHNPNVGLAYCQSWVADENSVTTQTMQGWTDDLDAERWQHDFINGGQDECGRYLILKCTIPNASGVLFRKSVYEAAGYADETMKVAGDWLMWAKMLTVADIAFVAEPLNYFRRHSNSVHTKKVRGLGTQERYQIIQYICENVPVTPQMKNAALNAVCEGWLTDVFSLNRRLPPARIASLYKAARQIEPAPQYRILRKSLGLLTRKLTARIANR